MSSVRKELLITDKVIEDVFDYQDFDPEISKIYSHFENSFQKLFDDYANLFNINNYCFYIKNDIRCNAFASNKKGYNIIGITNGYPILLKNKFSKEYFEYILLAGLLNEEPLSEAYYELYEDSNFDFNEFILECSIKFTFNHEFQHILQFNSVSKNNDSYLLHENLDITGFDMKKHVWEYDADRNASYEVLKYVFGVYRKLKYKNNEKLKCLLFVGCASMIMTQNLFYLGIMNQVHPKYTIKKVEYYKTKYSHPHPLVRCMNILECYYNNVTSDFQNLSIDPLQLLVNTVGIMDLYFKTLIPEQQISDHFFGELSVHLDDINQYNQELYEFAIKDTAIKNLLLSRNINLE